MAANTEQIELHRLAHSRTGDKGSTANISLIAYEAEWFPLLVDQVTEETVGELFRHRNPTSVRRYVLPKLCAMNFVLEDALDGGVNDSLNLDSHGKTLSFLLLSLKIEVPSELAAKINDSLKPNLPKHFSTSEAQSSAEVSQRAASISALPLRSSRLCGEEFEGGAE